MSLFRREATRPDVLVTQGRDMIKRVARAHQERWGAGTADRCDLDPTTGVLRWTFPDRVVEAPTRPLGRYTESRSLWTWAWADETFAPHLRWASDVVRRWGRVHGHDPLTVGSLAGITRERAGDLAAMAFVLSRATGFYRAPAGSSDLYLSFGPVTIVDRDGTPQPFTIDLGPSPRSDQRSWAGASTAPRASEQKTGRPA